MLQDFKDVQLEDCFELPDVAGLAVNVCDDVLLENCTRVRPGEVRCLRVSDAYHTNTGNNLLASLSRIKLWEIPALCVCTINMTIGNLPYYSKRLKAPQILHGLSAESSSRGFEQIPRCRTPFFSRIYIYYSSYYI